LAAKQGMPHRLRTFENGMSVAELDGLRRNSIHDQGK